MYLLLFAGHSCVKSIVYVFIACVSYLFSTVYVWIQGIKLLICNIFVAFLAVCESSLRL